MIHDYTESRGYGTIDGKKLKRGEVCRRRICEGLYLDVAPKSEFHKSWITVGSEKALDAQRAQDALEEKRMREEKEAEIDDGLYDGPQGYLDSSGYVVRPAEGYYVNLHDGNFSDIPDFDKAMGDYKSLFEVLVKAFKQASEGKGVERHGNGLPFDQQPIMEIGRSVGAGFTLGQAMKKIQESHTLFFSKGKEAAQHEILGAINYLAAAYLLYGESPIMKITEKSKGAAE